jgi:DNA-binding NtrC family response regulator
MLKSDVQILVVDDDLNLRELLIDTLNTIGYAAEAAEDGIQALDMLERRPFDLVISDVRMPGMDGVGLLKKIRRHYPDLPVLFITGVESPEVIGRASPDGFLAKPFRISHIEELIRDTLNDRQEQTANPIRKVMVVDDDDLFREMLADSLNVNGYTPYAVTGGEEALHELENGRVDAVITDIRMPGMDGITLMKEVKQRYPDLPVILITAFLSSDEINQEPVKSQADGFLQKPFEIDNIVRMLRSLSPGETS